MEAVATWKLWTFVFAFIYYNMKGFNNFNIFFLFFTLFCGFMMPVCGLILTINFLENMLSTTFSPIRRLEKVLTKSWYLFREFKKYLGSITLFFFVICNNARLQKLFHNVLILLRLDILDCWFGVENRLVVTQVYLININNPFIFSYYFFSFYVNIFRNFPTDILQLREKHPNFF